MNQNKVVFEVEKQTKNMLRFQEVSNECGVECAIGTLYVHKNTLSMLGFKPSDKLVVTLGKEE